MFDESLDGWVMGADDWRERGRREEEEGSVLSGWVGLGWPWTDLISISRRVAMFRTWVGAGPAWARFLATGRRARVEKDMV